MNKTFTFNLAVVADEALLEMQVSEYLQNALSLDLDTEEHGVLVESVSVVYDNKFPVQCPKCGSYDVDYGDLEVMDNEVEQTASCDECGCEWVEIYSPKEIKILKE